MEEHFILPSVAERLNSVLSERAQASDEGIDISFQDARNGMLAIGKEQFEVSLVDLPCVVESYKTYDDNVLIKAADIGQMLLVRDKGEPAPEGDEHKDGITPAMRDPRKRRFRRDATIDTEIVQNVENDLVNILAGGTARDVDVEVVEQEEDVEEAEPVPAPVVAVAAPAQAAAVAATAKEKAPAAPVAIDEYDDSSDENGYYEDSDEY